MKSSIFLSFLLVGCFTLSSCYVMPDSPNGRRKPTGPAAEAPNVTSQTQQEIQKQREALQAAAESKKKAATEAAERSVSETTTTEKPASEKRTDYPFANPVPGKEGFVFSPFNNKLVDGRDIPSGTLVQDPTYPASEKKYFRVP